MEVRGQQQTPVTAVPKTESPVPVAERAAWNIWRRKNLVLLPGIEAKIVEPTAYDYRLRSCGSPFEAQAYVFLNTTPEEKERPRESDIRKFCENEGWFQWVILDFDI
jgi:hypothetical protein